MSFPKNNLNACKTMYVSDNHRLYKMENDNSDILVCGIVDLEHVLNTNGDMDREM